MSRPTTTAQLTILAGLTLSRITRSKVAWAAVFLALLPAVFARLWISFRPSMDAWSDIFNAVLTLYAILPPLLCANLLNEERTLGTLSYLWSRPVQRSSIFVGKLLGGIAFLAVLFTLSLVGCWLMLLSSEQAISAAALARGILALVSGSIAFAALCTTLGTLVGKQASAVTIAYTLLIDLPLGSLSFAIGKLAISQHVRLLATNTEPIFTHLAWLLAIAAFWIILGIWRTEAFEFANKSQQ